MKNTIKNDQIQSLSLDNGDDESFFGLDAEQIPEEQLAHVTGGGRFAHPSEATTIPAAFR